MHSSKCFQNVTVSQVIVETLDSPNLRFDVSK